MCGKCRIFGRTREADMTGSMVERSPRTMSTSAGFGGLRSICAGLAVRGLIVVGFAGVAWLLSASAAHASDEPSRAPQGDVAWSLFGTADQGGMTALFGTGDAVSGLVRTLAGDH